MSTLGPPVYSAKISQEGSGPVPVNNPIEFVLVFQDQYGTPFDPPSGISITVDDGTGASTIYTTSTATVISKYAVGVYNLEIEATNSGDWLARGQGLAPNGDLVTSEDVEVVVDSTQVS